MAYRLPDRQALVRAQKEAALRAALAERAMAQRSPSLLPRTVRVLVQSANTALILALMIVLLMVKPVPLALAGPLIGAIFGLLGLDLACDVYRWRRSRAHDATLLGALPFSVHADLQGGKSSSIVRARATLARAPDAELSAMFHNLVGALPAPTVVGIRDAGVVFVTDVIRLRDPREWLDALLEDVLLPIHTVVPIVEVHLDKHCGRRSIVMTRAGEVSPGPAAVRELFESYLVLLRESGGPDGPGFERFRETLAERRAAVAATGPSRVELTIQILNRKIEVVGRSFHE
jgi:hypothetical protein